MIETPDNLIDTLNGLNRSLEESNDALEQKQKEDEADIQALERQVRSPEDQLQDAKDGLDVVKVSSRWCVVADPGLGDGTSKKGRKKHGNTMQACPRMQIRPNMPNPVIFSLHLSASNRQTLATAPPPDLTV
ncbi:hypothetical protein QFC22_004664 [Naganishia vaughanmartiniae]|uniref:Uncharacterized protein n=1 Tax=Naganishia vaughanmartiniae TaxID=1424756 RepID=A0ACC2X039_9TREE|nr:hypothetical protein QFC22_004664 [Naganishia vaughanmartiniae]